MILFASNAFALVCTGLTTETCDAVNAMEASIEATQGDVINDTGPNRLKPLTIYNQLENLRLALGDDGCRVDYSFDGWDAGTWGGGSWGGSWDDGDTGSTGGSYGGRVVTGSYGGDAVGTIGDLFGEYNRVGQAAANRDDGFVAGRWIRTSGKRGVYVALHGSCDPGVDPWTALDPWYQGTLEGPPPSVDEDVTIEVTTDDQMLWWIDGVQVPSQALDIDWQQENVQTITLTPGTHVIAIRALDLASSGMVQFRATDSEGQVLRVSETTSWKGWNATSNGEPTGWEQPSFDDSGWSDAIQCGVPFDPPWNSNPLGDATDANFIWAAPSCSSVNLALMRTTITL